MKITNGIYACIVFTGTFLPIFQKAISQESLNSPDSLTYNKHKLPAIAMGVGVYSFLGDLGDLQDNALTRNTHGMHVAVQKRINRFGSIGFQGMKGALSQSNRAPNQLLSFKTAIAAAQVSLTAHLDNDLILNKESRIAPYVGAGISFISFDPKGDLKDKDGNPYYYWEIDQTLRDGPYDAKNLQNHAILTRDYHYETPLGATQTFDKSVLSVPLNAGVSFKLNDMMETKLDLSYHLTQSDFIDGYSPPGTANKDRFLYFSFSLVINPSGKINPQDLVYENVDFEAIEELDSDGDGVVDFYDECQRTPAGVVVNETGCAPDDDNDGIPNYLDKELRTKPNTTVDEFGVTMTDAALIEEYLNDSLILHGVIFPKLSMMKRVSNAKVVNPEQQFIAGESITEAVAPEEKPEKEISTPVSNQTSEQKTKPVSVSKEKRTDSAVQQKKSQSNNQEVVFRVQLAALSSKSMGDRLKREMAINEEIFIIPSQDSYKYCIGSFRSLKDASDRCNQINAKRNLGAFVIALYNDEVISVWQAQKIIGAQD